MKGNSGSGIRSVAVIGMSGENRPGAKELLGQHHAHQRVGQGETGEPHQLIGFVTQCRINAIGATDDQRNRCSAITPRTHALRELPCGLIAAALIQNDPPGARHDG